MNAALFHKISVLCMATLLLILSDVMPTLAGSKSHSPVINTWSSLQVATPQEKLWHKGLSTEDLARRAHIHAVPTSKKQGSHADVASKKPLKRRKSPPPTWHGDTPEQREAISIRASMPVHNLTPSPATSSSLPINGIVEDRSYHWHVNPNRPNDAGEAVFAEHRQTIAGMLGYSDTQFSFGIGPEITIDNGQQASFMRSSGTSSSSASTQSGKDNNKDDAPPVDIGVGMRLRIGF